jgi:hypothetical protein
MAEPPGDNPNRSIERLILEIDRMSKIFDEWITSGVSNLQIKTGCTEEVLQKEIAAYSRIRMSLLFTPADATLLRNFRLMDVVVRDRTAFANGRPSMITFFKVIHILIYVGFSLKIIKKCIRLDPANLDTFQTMTTAIYEITELLNGGEMDDNKKKRLESLLTQVRLKIGPVLTWIAETRTPCAHFLV